MSRDIAVMRPPRYFEEIRARSSARWEQLEADPDLAAPWHQLFKQVQSPRHVLSELLQNADDAGATETFARIEHGAFVFEHNGNDFTQEHFASLCRFGYSNKRALHTIGFRGIGFKSTFSLGDLVELRTPTLSVAFERRRFTEPRWLESTKGDAATTSVRVPFGHALRQREIEKNLDEWLQSPVSLLFFRSIRRMRVGDREVHWGSLGPGPVANSEWMALHDDPDESYLVVRSEDEPFPDEALSEIKQERLLGGDDGAVFPPCRVEIVVGAPGRLYVVLPTGVETQLPFACNAPFIQDPARLKIKEPSTSPTNRWLLERTGRLAARVLLEWLEPKSGTVDERAQAYDVFPDVDRSDASLEGTTATTVEEAFDEAIADRPYLLTDDGDLVACGASIILPAAVRDVWPGGEAAAILDSSGRPALAAAVSSENRAKLVHWRVVEAFEKDALLRALREKHLPKPGTWRRLLHLWAYVASDLTDYRTYGTRHLVRILPVQGKDVLYSASEVVRLGERRLLQSEADWEFLSTRLLVLNQNWLRFITDQRREADQRGDASAAKQVEAASAVLNTCGLLDTSDVGQVIDRVAADLFGQHTVPLDECVQLAQIAASLGAPAGTSFRFVTRDRHLQAADHGVLFDASPEWEVMYPAEWANAHILHGKYSKFTSCTTEEWGRWVTSGRAGLLALAPLVSRRQTIYGFESVDSELRRRGFTGQRSRPYVTASFILEDWDFEPGIWKHWETLAREDDLFWARLVERILLQPDSYWTKARNARVLQVATTGNTQPVTYGDVVLPGWILQLRQRRCLRDTRGACHVPGDLLRRTPDTEPFLDVEPFVHGSLDTEKHRTLLDLLGVRSEPTGPDRLIGCLRTLAQSNTPPATEVEKWYRRLDQLMETASTADATAITNAFRSEKLILSDAAGWTGSAGVFLSADEDDAPGAPVIRAGVRDLALWRRVGVAERPTADLAVQWLKSLQSGSALPSDEARRVRTLLARHPVRIWEECGHWLNMAGEWAQISGLRYALTMQTLVPWSHLHKWVKQVTADLQKLNSETCDAPPFAALPRLAHCVEERLGGTASLFGETRPRPWLQRLGRDLCRVILDDETETERVRCVAARLATTSWVEATDLEMVPYIEGVPAGTPRQAEAAWIEQHLHVVRRPPARLARVVSSELDRAFRRTDIADVIKLCFERDADFVTAVVEESFTMAPVADGDSAVIDRPDERSPEPELVQIIPEDVEPSPQFAPGDEPDPGGPKDNELDIDSDRSKREHPNPRPQKPHLIERFARARGFAKDSGDRYYHSDGSWLAKAHGSLFPWEQRTSAGALVRAYWPKEHCLDREPLQVQSEVWDALERFPERYSLILVTESGAPIEVEGGRLKALRTGGHLTVFPATYRIVAAGQAPHPHGPV